MASDIVCSPSCVFRRVRADTYRCTVHGTTHECGAACTRRYVGADAQVQCELTARVFAAAVASHDFVPVERGASVRRRGKSVAANKVRQRGCAALSTAAVVAVCEEVVHNLFYGWPRAMLAREQKQRLLARVKAEFLRGVGGDVAAASRGAVRACVRRIVHIVREHAPVRTARVDHAVVRRVAREVAGVWEKMVKTPYCGSDQCAMRIEDVVLGCCYLMKEGLRSPDGPVWVPRSSVVAALLPPISAVGKMGFRVKQITVGKNEVFKAFRSASPSSRGTSGRSVGSTA